MIIMKILYSGEGLVDFGIPPAVSEEQKTKIIEFLKQMFIDVELVDTKEKEKHFNSVNKTSKKWKPKDLLMLLEPLSEEELAEKLDRSPMSIRMYRGHFEPDLRSFMIKKYGNAKKPTLDDINEMNGDEK